MFILHFKNKPLFLIKLKSSIPFSAAYPGPGYGGSKLSKVVLMPLSPATFFQFLLGEPVLLYFHLIGRMHKNYMVPNTPSLFTGRVLPMYLKHKKNWGFPRQMRYIIYPISKGDDSSHRTEKIPFGYLYP